MTVQSSSKGCFVTYFKYRLGIMKMNFVMCCILNVLGLPLYAVAANVGFGGVVSEFALTARVFSMICIGALPAAAVFNALSSFDYYHKKDLTDTVGALPLSHKQRFFADLLAGLAVNAAPIIPCGIFCVIAFGSMQGKLQERYSELTNGDFHTVSLGLYIAAAVLFVVVFTYLFSVLTSVCCGKVFHSVLFCVIAIVILPLLCGGTARCFGNAVLGIESREYFWKAVAFFPPAGILHLLLIAMDVPFSIGFDSDILEYLFASFGFVQILVYLILAAGIIAGAYFLSKRRLSESTGSAFAIKPMFWVLSGGLTAAITVSAFNVTYDWHGIAVSYPIFSAAVGLLVCLVTILFYPQRKKTFLRSLAVGAGAVALMLAAWFVIDKTGALGARYLPKNPDKIEHVKLNGTYTITDKNDIEAFTSKLNEELHDNPSDLADRNSKFGSFFVEAKKTNGKSIARNYSDGRIGEEIFRSLDGYVDYFFEELERNSEYRKAYISYSRIASVNSAMNRWEFYIPDEKVPELIQILHEEAKEKYDPNAKTAVEIAFTHHGDRYFAITEDYTRTIAFLSDIGDVISETDPGLTYLGIDYSIIGEEWEVLRVHVPFADKDDERVKELVALLEDCEGEEPLTDFRINAFVGTKEPAVTEKHKARILELMRQLAADYFNE